MKNRAIKAGKAKHTEPSTFSLQINVMVPLRGGHLSSSCCFYAGCGFGSALVKKAFGCTLALLRQSGGHPAVLEGPLLRVTSWAYGTPLLSNGAQLEGH